MDVARTLREARTAARLTQRQLAAQAGVPQLTVARIERGQMMPRADTLGGLLKAAGYELNSRQRPGFGVDRTLIREALRMTPDQRLRIAVASSNNLERLRRTARPVDGR